MNSGELKVDVPLASIESDCEDPGDGCSALNTPSRKDNKQLTSSNNKPKPKMSSLNFDNGGDSVTGSLEDLVNSFDEKLTMCFQDYQEQVDKIAPVQVLIGSDWTRVPDPGLKPGFFHFWRVGFFSLKTRVPGFII